MNPLTRQGADDPRLRCAAQEYLAELERGQCPSRADFLARFPDLVEDLPTYLDALDMFHGAAPLLDQPDSEPLLSRQPLGDFRLVRELARGGMGVVYEAVQMSLGRRVALKVLPSASALEPRQLRRFQNEAQAAAQLHHTNIVPVYAVGSDRGVHYYAMQLIEGRNLSDVLDEMRAGKKTGPKTATEEPSPEPDAATPPMAALTTQRAARSPEYFRTVARLAAHAAEALEHAHQFGIVHRDIKPGNLMLDGDGEIWITDFGLAQFRQGQAVTRTGDVVGTLRYMSPEQAGGQRALLDGRTDIYSIGATLYEMLTLQPIFAEMEQARLLKRILHDEPVPPRTVTPAVPPELETIVLKAVAKAPEDRYASAAELADDLHRFLEHRPILARRPTAVQRLRKWGRRHPSLVVAAAILLVIVSIVSVASAALINVEKSAKEAAFQRERDRAEEAENRFRLARRSVDEMIQISEQELAGKPHFDSVRRRLLDAALIYYQEFIDQRRDNPAAQEELRETKARVQKIIGDLALLQGAAQIRLLGEPAVLDDLDLTDSQRATVNEFTAEVERKRFESFGDFRRLSPEQRHQQVVKLIRADQVELNRILTAYQRERLSQVALQAQGTAAFHDSDVVARLTLTPEQRERIRGIEAETLMGLFDPNRPPDFQAVAAKLTNRE